MRFDFIVPVQISFVIISGLRNFIFLAFNFRGKIFGFVEGLGELRDGYLFVNWAVRWGLFDVAEYIVSLLDRLFRLY